MPRKKKFKKKEEPSVGHLLRVMEVLDFAPGHRRTPDGPPIGILTMAHDDHIERPMLITLEDTERLMVKCLEVLASHKDKFAKYLIDEYLTDKPEGETGPDVDDDDAGEEWKRR